jgi:hypothetical protein
MLILVFLWHGKLGKRHDDSDCADVEERLGMADLVLMLSKPHYISI